MDIFEETIREKMRQQTQKYLEELSRNGARISVEGHSLSMQQMAGLFTMNEGVCYMPDYLTDDSGKVVEIRFDRVRLI